MAKEKKEQKNWTSPKGKANYCWLNRPDTTFNADGVYQTNLIVPKEEAKDLCQKLKALHKDAQVEFQAKNKKGKKADLPYFINDDGDVEFKFSQRAVIKSKKTGEEFKKTVAIFDSKGHPCSANIGRGTLMRVSFLPQTFYHPSSGAGVTLRLKAVKILNLVEWSAGDDAKAYGFEEEEEGWEAEDDQLNEENWDDDNENTPEDNEDEPESEDSDEDTDDGEEEDDDIPF